MLIRSGGLADSMSRYLIRRIEETPSIVLRTQAEITTLEGGDHLERVQCRDNRTQNVETHDIRPVFVMTGAIPNTRWLHRRLHSCEFIVKRTPAPRLLRAA